MPTQLDEVERSLVLHMLCREPGTQFLSNPHCSALNLGQPLPNGQQDVAPASEEHKSKHEMPCNTGTRLSAADYLAQWAPRLFPASFAETVHPLFKAMLTLDADTRVELLREAFPALSRPLDDAPQDAAQPATSTAAQTPCAAYHAAPEAPGLSVAGGAQSPALLADSVEGLLQDTQRLLASLAVGGEDTVTDSMFAEPPAPALPPQPTVPLPTLPDTAALTLLTALLCTLLRGARLADHRVVVLRMLTRAAWGCDDAVKLQRVVPYVLAVIGTPTAVCDGAMLVLMVVVLLGDQ